MAKIFVKTGNLKNKGDMLMLLAITQRYGAKHEIAVLPSSCGKSISKTLGVVFCMPCFTTSKQSPSAFFKNLVRRALNVLPDFILRGFGFVSSRNMSLVLDASGFAYGEYWGAGKIKSSINMYSSFKGINVVFMPQSFGPFESPFVKERMKTLVRGSPMICARDRLSYKYIEPMVSSSSDVFCYPDFTFDVVGNKPVFISLPKKYVVFMPSHRVAENIGHETLSLLYKNSYEAAAKCHFEVVVLAHDTEHDFDIAEKLRLYLGIEKAVLVLDDVREIRWVISKSSLVLGSRFHGLVNALSQCVPAIGLGWTHKFDCLFEDYGVGEFLVKDENDFMGVSRMVYDLLDHDGEGKREAVLSAMKKNREILYDRASLMWRRLDNIVDAVRLS